MLPAKLAAFPKRPVTEESMPDNPLNPLIIDANPFSIESNTLAKIPDMNCSMAHNAPFRTLFKRLLNMLVKNAPIDLRTPLKRQPIKLATTLSDTLSLLSCAVPIPSAVVFFFFAFFFNSSLIFFIIFFLITFTVPFNIPETWPLRTAMSSCMLIISFVTGSRTFPPNFWAVLIVFINSLILSLVLLTVSVPQIEKLPIFILVASANPIPAFDWSPPCQ